MRVNNRYDIKEEIGAGGMGTVYRAIDSRSAQVVAIKALKEEAVAADPDLLERFTREAEALRRLNHPNIVEVLDTFEYQGINYIVMEYVSGGSLFDMLEKQGQIPVARALEIMLDLTDALTRAHRLDIIHRDLKPANVLIAEDGTPRLTDFGVAHIAQEERVTKTGIAIGTLDYISPELFNNQPVDKRTDIWSFGVMFFEMLLGERPFQGASVSQIIKAILTDPVPDLETLRGDLPVALIDLIYRMLERDVHARIPSARLIGAELEAIIQGHDTGSIQRVAVPTSGARFGLETVMATPVSPDDLMIQNNLPVQATPFVGRYDELDTLQEMLENPTTRLVALLGPGGMGKTRLALEAARSNLYLFPDGVFFIPLAPLEDATLLIPTIADHIDFTFGGADNHEEQLISYLGEKQILLVIDNFEHLIDQANVINNILQGAPRLNLIVTSRERLRLRNEHVFEMRGMIAPQPGELPAALREYPSVKLFCQSAYRVMPDFEVDEVTAPHVAQICNQVQGLPLGIELAAAWLEMLTVQEIVDEIDRSLDFLESNLQDVPERHRSIRAVFEYSWNLMREDERDTFMKLAVFRGGFEREAAQAIAGAGLRTLNALINKSLLSRDPTGRYRLHTLLRQYAEDHLENNPDHDAVCQAHADYFARFMSKIQLMFNTKNEQAAIEMLEVDLENVRSAWHWAIKNQQWEPLEQIIYAMLLFHLGRSMLREGGTLFDGLAQALQTQGQGNTPLYWRARSYQAWLSNTLGDYDLVWQYAEGAYNYFQKANNGWAMSEALNNMSYVKMMQGEYGESVEFAALAIEASKQPGVPPISWFMGMGNKGYAEFLRGNYEAGRRIYEEVITRSKTVDYSPTGNAYMLNNLGEIVRAMGDHARARELIEDAYGIFERQKMLRGMAFTLNNLGGLEFFAGNHADAKDRYWRAYELNKEIGDTWGIGHSLSALGNTSMVASEYAEAREYFEESLKVRRAMGQQKGVGESLIDLARVAAIEEDYQAAKKFSEEALAIHQEIGDRFGTSSALLGLGVAYLGLRETDAALAKIEEARALSKDLKKDLLVERIAAARGEIALMQEDYATAEQMFCSLLESGVQETGSERIVAVALTGYAEIVAHRGDKERALELITLAKHCVQEFALYAPLIERRKNTLIDRLTTELPDKSITAVYKRAETQTLTAVAEELLASKPG